MSDYAAKLLEIAESQYGDPAAGDRLLHANWIRGAAEHIKAIESRLDQIRQHTEMWGTTGETVALMEIRRILDT